MNKEDRKWESIEDLLALLARSINRIADDVKDIQTALDAANERIEQLESAPWDPLIESLEDRLDALEFADG